VSGFRSQHEQKWRRQYFCSRRDSNPKPTLRYVIAHQLGYGSVKCYLRGCKIRIWSPLLTPDPTNLVQICMTYFTGHICVDFRKSTSHGYVILQLPSCLEKLGSNPDATNWVSFKLCFSGSFTIPTWATLELPRADNFHSFFLQNDTRFSRQKLLRRPKNAF